MDGGLNILKLRNKNCFIVNFFTILLLLLVKWKNLLRRNTFCTMNVTTRHMTEGPAQDFLVVGVANIKCGELEILYQV